MSLISVESLSRHFERRGTRKGWFRREPPQIFRAVESISFDIAPGERVAFIGPNGAGKSTTLKMLTGILYPSGGQARVAGYTPWKDRTRLALEIGIVFGQRSQLWSQLSVADSFDLLGAIYRLDRTAYRIQRDRLIEMLRLSDVMGQTARSLSLGQRMRCEIAASLLHRPKILFLDEPTIGLDVTAKALLREHLKTLTQEESTTIILTSHDTGDIEEICERVLLINHGRLVLDRPLSALRADFLSRKQLVLVTEDEDPQLDLPGTRIISRDRHRLTLEVETDKLSIQQTITQALASMQIRDLTIENAPLESIMMSLYGEAAE